MERRRVMLEQASRGQRDKSLLKTKNPGAGLYHPIFDLQATIGNQALQRILDPGAREPQKSSPQLNLPKPEDTPRLTARDRQKIENYLISHQVGLDPYFGITMGDFCTTFDHVVEEVWWLFYPFIPRREIIRQIRVYLAPIAQRMLSKTPLPAAQKIPNIFNGIPAIESNPGNAPPKPNQLTAGMSYALHIQLADGKMEDPDCALQLQIGADGDLSQLFQINYNLNTGEVQMVSGGQAQAEQELVKGILKMSGFVQIISGAAWSGSLASGAFLLQSATGLQLTLTWKSLQFGAQLAASVTAAQGKPATVDPNAVGQVAVPMEPRSPYSRPGATGLTELREIRDWVRTHDFLAIQRLGSDERLHFLWALLNSEVSKDTFEAIERLWENMGPAERRAGGAEITARIKRPPPLEPASQQLLQKLMEGVL